MSLTGWPPCTKALQGRRNVVIPTPDSMEVAMATGSIALSDGKEPGAHLSEPLS